MSGGRDRKRVRGEGGRRRRREEAKSVIDMMMTQQVSEVVHVTLEAPPTCPTHSHIGYFIPEQCNEFLVSVVSGAIPPGSVELPPQSPETHSQPLLQDRVGLVQLLQTQGDHSTLQTALL